MTASEVAKLLRDAAAHKPKPTYVRLHCTDISRNLIGYVRVISLTGNIATVITDDNTTGTNKPTQPNGIMFKVHVDSLSGLEASID